MTQLAYRQQKIQKKRKQTPWRQFVREICSRMPTVLYKERDIISRFPQTWREWIIVEVAKYNSWDIVDLPFVKNSFFDNLVLLFRSQPKMSIQQWFENENSSYAECYWAKNSYLCFGVWQHTENIAYTVCSNSNIRNVFNSLYTMGNCDNIYSSKIVTWSYNTFYSSNIHDSHNIWFSSNLIGCSECLLCNGLQNVSYCISNIQYNKEEYLYHKDRLLKEKQKFTVYHIKAYSHSLDNKNSKNVTWWGIVQSHDLENAYIVKNIGFGRNILIAWWKDSSVHFYDSFDAWNQVDEHLYATHYVWETSSHVYCVSSGANLHNVYYSYYLESCSYCLGCIWLKNKSYCIFNKQYTKEERHRKVDEIFSEMEKDGTLGEFFPWRMNPFYFNDTAAYLIDDTFTKEEVEKEGYLRRDEPIKVDIPEGVEVVKTSKLSDYEWRRHPELDSGSPWKPWDTGSESSMTHAERWIDPEIMKKVIQDEEGNVYRIVKMEYDFLMKHGLPLPRLHWLERLKMNFKIQ